MVRAIKGSYSGIRLGFTAKDEASHPGLAGNLASLWLAHAWDRAGLAKSEVAAGLSAVMADKDDAEVGLSACEASASSEWGVLERLALYVLCLQRNMRPFMVCGVHVFSRLASCKKLR